MLLYVRLCANNLLDKEHSNALCNLQSCTYAYATPLLAYTLLKFGHQIVLCSKLLDEASPALSHCLAETPGHAVSSPSPLQVSTADAMVLLRRVLALRRQAGADAVTIDAKAALEANPSSSSPLPQQADPAIEAVNTPEAGPALGPGADASVPDAQIQAGCTAVVAVFQARLPPTLLDH